MYVSNLDMIIIQSKPADLDVLIEDYGFEAVMNRLTISDINSLSHCSQGIPVFQESSEKIWKRPQSISRSGSFSDTTKPENFMEEKRDRSGSTGSNSGKPLSDGRSYRQKVNKWRNLIMVLYC